MGVGAEATATGSMAIGRDAVSTVANRIAIGTTISSYQLAGLTGVPAGQLYTVVVDSNGNLSAQDLNPGTAGLLAQTTDFNNAAVWSDTASKSTSFLDDLFGTQSKEQSPKQEAVDGSVDSDSRLDQLFALVEQQQVQMEQQQTPVSYTHLTLPTKA